MYNVSTAYKNAIYGTNRKNYARFFIDGRNTTEKSATPTVTTNGEYVLSNVTGSLSNGQRQQEYQLVSTEADRVKLDGTFRFCPDSPTAAQVNFVSSRIADSDGQFLSSGSVVITCTYATVFNITGFTVTFDTNANEYAVNYDVVGYNAAGTVLFTDSIINNDLVNRQSYVSGNNVKTIIISIYKWSVGSRRARITELEAGIVFFYTDNKIVKMNLTEETARVMDNLIIPELTISIQDQPKYFDPLISNGAFSRLKQRQEINAELGLDLGESIEYVPFGKFYLNDWKTDYNSFVVTFTSFNILSNLNYVLYEQLTSKTNYTFYDAAIDILTVAGITNYSISAVLADLTYRWTYGLVSKRSAKEALQMVAIASGAIIYADRTGKVYITRQYEYPTIVNTITENEQFEFPISNRTVACRTVAVNWYSNLTTVGGYFEYTNTYVPDGLNLFIDGNTLLNNSYQAINNCAFIVSDCYTYQKTYDVRFRGNPSLEMWDRIQLSTTNGIVYPHIIKIELTYDGSITSRIIGSDLI